MSSSTFTPDRDFAVSNRFRPVFHHAMVKTDKRFVCEVVLLQSVQSTGQPLMIFLNCYTTTHLALAPVSLSFSLKCLLDFVC